MPYVVTGEMGLGSLHGREVHIYFSKRLGCNALEIASPYHGLADVGDSHLVGRVLVSEDSVVNGAGSYSDVDG